MNRRLPLHLLAATLLVAGIVLTGYAQKTTPLTIHMSNFKSSEGVAMVNLFREKDDIPQKPFKSVKAMIANGNAEVLIYDLLPGSYAAIAYHDENSNGILDHKLGFPNEPMGFSNKWELGLFSGMPTFRKLKFEYGKSETVIEIIID
jgi:uncharacterized protein (DUF2141 family)